MGGRIPDRCGEGVTLLVAEDDDDDFLLTEKAFRESSFACSIRRVGDGEELMSFLHGEVLGGGGARRLLVLLDLNMPRKDGRMALAEIKSHPELRRIPVVVLTTSTAEGDLVGAYGLGANSFIRKPAGFDEFAELVRTVGQYWFQVADIPRCGAASAAR